MTSTLAPGCFNAASAVISIQSKAKRPWLHNSELLLSLTKSPHRSGLWEGPETPQAWLTAMARKKSSLSRWEGAVARGDLLDKPVDLSNLFNPNTFLNAVRQQVSAPQLSSVSFTLGRCL